MFLFSSSAYAIKCDDEAQVQKDGTQIVTPYCQDEYLSTVATGFGVYASPSTIRINVHKKMDVCKVVGHDERISDNCSYLIDNGDDD